MIHPTNDNDLEKKRVFIQRTTEAEIKDKPQEYEYDINLIPRSQIDSRYDSTTINWILMTEPEQLTDITLPHVHDVLSGRGNFVNHHAGNEHFRSLWDEINESTALHILWFLIDHITYHANIILAFDRVKKHKKDYLASRE